MDGESLLLAAGSGDLDLLRYLLNYDKSDNLFGYFNKYLANLNREALILLYPRTSMEKQSTTALIDRLLDAGQSDCAAFPINYSSGSTLYSLETALAASAEMLAATGSGEDGITADMERTIAGLDDPLEALQYYFEHKRYKGYVDTQILSPAELEVPDYLQRAVEESGADWLVLLKKEIHARHGARFTDPLARSVFAGCSWFKEKYNLDLSTVIRLPKSEAVTEVETANFCFIEGLDLHRKKAAHPGNLLAFDLNGGVYFLKIGKIELDNADFYTAYGYPSAEACDNAVLLDTINGIIGEHGAVIEEIDDEYLYAGFGC